MEKRNLFYCQSYHGQKLIAHATMNKVFLMVFTRSHQSSSYGITSFSILDAAKALLNLHNSSVISISSSTSNQVIPTSINQSDTYETPSQTKFWTSYTNRYHAFLSEATDESPSAPIASRRAVATSRWVTFASKQLRCSESEVRGWLRTADQKSLLTASA